MNIAIFTDAFYPQINGVVTSIMSIAENMTKRGHKVVVVAPKYGRIEVFWHPKIKIKRVPSIPAKFYDDFRWTALVSKSTYKMMKKEEIDIVHFMTPVTVSYLGIKMARKLNLPVVGTFHTFITDPAYYEQLFSGIIKATEEGAWNYTNLYYNAADYVTAPTQKAVDIIKKHKCTVPIEAISNGIDISTFKNAKHSKFSKKYNLKDKVILYVGRVSQEKNIFLLIESFFMVQHKHPDAQLLIVGTGPQIKEVEKFVSQKSDKKSIIITGAIPHNELIKSGVFRSAALFATASETETQGITVLEAQANGLICVGVKAGGLPDLIEHNVTGYMCKPGDVKQIAKSIIRVLDGGKEHAKMKENIRDALKKHDMKLVINRWEELYSTLIRDKKSGKIPHKDYLHLKQILYLSRQLKIDFSTPKNRIKKIAKFPFIFLTGRK
ncbi:MAG: glycosyltransferase [Spirochaetes bacterium]|nr:glycosyltransferase [Spirochaetota bacterium]